MKIPASWRSTIERDDFVSTFFNAYNEFQQASHAKRVLDCLVQVVAIRKGVFSGEEERTKFITSIMQGIRDTILSLRHVEDEECYQAFCRLIQRFRAAAPLNDLADMPGYVEWIELVATFSQNAFRTGHCFHLLKFWSRIVEGMTYFQQLGEVTVKKLQEITEGLVRTFMATRIAAAGGVSELWEEDPLEDEDHLIETLGMLGLIARCRYVQSCAALIEMFDPVVAEYQVFISQASMAGVVNENVKEAIDVYETKFAWFIYFMAVFVGNRPVKIR